MERELVLYAVYNAIGVGRENAVSREALAELTGLSDRVVRQAIEDLRQDRAILSLDKGYYIPYTNDQGRQETAIWLAKQRSRASSIRRATRGAERFIGDVPGQMEMAGVDEDG